ncbi:MAG: DNA translocase FtsK 4TM domain-containing protein [Brevundimonas sp.]|uniref:DNA translocase FtsK 4TM domain-containing protein n=1 Tax=Brevundimonas sp. TaxID=1871086 RepID=UPI0027339959|nr:DNA translocase FtsK 4TM domain-containing protein [Brevundimonas sp.]MDP3404552.1 DNA translocase FtsK 4TM domain-containing protein [Brevundimonas sp.]
MSAALAIGQRALLGARLLWDAPFLVRFRGVLQALLATLLTVALVSWNPTDPSLNAASSSAATNWLGTNGALFADLFMQSLGLAAWPAAALTVAFGLAAAIGDALQQRLKPTPLKALAASGGVLSLSAALSALAAPTAWPLAAGLGGLWGDAVIGMVEAAFRALQIPGGGIIGGLAFLALGLWACGFAVGLRTADLGEAVAWASSLRRIPVDTAPSPVRRRPARAEPEIAARPSGRKPARLELPEDDAGVDAAADATPPWDTAVPEVPVSRPAAAPEPRVAAVKPPKASKKAVADDQAVFDFVRPEGDFSLPPLAMLAKPQARVGMVDETALKQNAKMLEGVLAEFGVKGVIDQIRPGPVVTLYELVPAPGVKHGRVVALSDDIARSMSARACRISVVPNRNAIGIELPNL